MIERILEIIWKSGAIAILVMVLGIGIMLGWTLAPIIYRDILKLIAQ